MAVIKPDLIADVTLYPTSEGGRTGPLLKCFGQPESSTCGNAASSERLQ
jgi:hypothetical protein